jgi:GT2 family glycosyltransferase
MLWVLRPLVKQSFAHLRWATRHPRRYAREARPMVREKIELLAALQSRDETPPPHDNLPVLGDTPLVTVVIVTRDRPESLRGTLAALRAQTWTCGETVIVDHDPNVRTREVAEDAGSRYVEAAGLTLAGARQRGVDAARGEIVAFTDDDCLPAQDWLEQLVDAFQKDMALWGAQGRTIAEDGPIGTHAVRVERGSTLYETCNIAYRREALRRAGGFDLRFSGWFEDTALGARVRKHGPIGFVRDAIVVHRAMPRHERDRATWRLILHDEMLLSCAYPAFYRRTRGRSFLTAVVTRWLIGSPLKTLVQALPQGWHQPRAMARLILTLVRERFALVQALCDVLRSDAPVEDQNQVDRDSPAT